MPSTIEELEKRPEAKNLIGIYSSLTDLNLEKSIKEFSGKNFSEFKEKFSQVLVEKINQYQKKLKNY
jgi:tryptophanyl-tRNA synthetase